MKSNGHEGKGDRHGWPSTIDVDEGPYLPTRTKESAEADGDRPDREVIERTVGKDEDSPPAEEGSRGRRGRKVLGFLIAALGLVCVGLALIAIYGGRRRLDYKITEKSARRPEHQAQTGAGIEEDLTDEITAGAIKEAKEEMRKPGASGR